MARSTNGNERRKQSPRLGTDGATAGGRPRSREQAPWEQKRPTTTRSAAVLRLTEIAPSRANGKNTVAAGRGNELRDEGEKEQLGFWIQRFAKDALTKNAVRGAGVFDGRKRHGGGGQNRGEAEGGGEDVEGSADEGAEGR